jgi:RNA ligase (TIGR02306 family)
MTRKLASVQRISDIQPIENADAIERVSILGWACVARRGEFKIGDLCIYFEIDSLLPESAEFEFMRNRKFRVKTVKLRGCISQGLALPISELNLNISYLQEGDDVTHHLGVTKYEPDIKKKGYNAKLSGKIKGTRPAFVPKTDEQRVQSCPKLINEMMGLECYQTTKMDGSSMSVYWYDRIPEPFGVCSRNILLEEDPENAFWKVAHRYDIKSKLEQGGLGNIIIQGELMGPGIQGNRLELKELDWYIFNIYNPNTGMYGGMTEIKEVCSVLGLKMVPVEDVFRFNLTLGDLLERAKGYYPSGRLKEGIVVRPIEARLSPSMGYSLLSLKAINNDFLLSNEA